MAPVAPPEPAAGCGCDRIQSIQLSTAGTGVDARKWLVAASTSASPKPGSAKSVNNDIQSTHRNDQEKARDERTHATELLDDGFHRRCCKTFLGLSLSLLLLTKRFAFRRRARRHPRRIFACQPRAIAETSEGLHRPTCGSVFAHTELSTSVALTPSDDDNDSLLT